MVRSKMEIVIIVDYDLPDCLGSEKLQSQLVIWKFRHLYLCKRATQLTGAVTLGRKAITRTFTRLISSVQKVTGIFKVYFLCQILPHTMNEGYLQSHIIIYLTQALSISLNSGKIKGLLQTSRGSSLKFEGTLMNMMAFGILRFGAKVAAA